MHKEYLIDFDLYVIYKDGRIYSKFYKKFLKGYINKDGYVVVTLKCIDGNRLSFTWQRVIWYAFNGEIPEGMQVNHINEDKTDNRLCNLNLMTPKENTNWGTRTERAIAKLKGVPRKEETKRKLSAKLKNHPLTSKPVEAIDKNGNVVHRYASSKEAERNGFTATHVIACCRGDRRTCGGYGWRYA